MSIGFLPTVGRLDVFGTNRTVRNIDRGEINELRSLFQLRVVDLGSRVSRSVIVGMQTRKKEDCRNTFRKERPLIAALQELLCPKVVSEAQGQAGLVIHTRNDRLQIRTVGRTKNVHGIAVLGSPFLRNSL